MASEALADSQLEIGHVLFLDIVGYSKLTMEEQRERQSALNNVVRATDQFRASSNSGNVIALPTGDGMALVFRDNIEAPARCALEIWQLLRAHPHLPVRMGIHSGPVSDVSDVNERVNVAGDGINTAQRVMDCGDAGHILLSKRVADDLRQYTRWRAHLHDLATVEVKHGVKIDIFNLAGDGIGNSALPEKVARRRAELAATTKRSRTRRRLFVAAAATAALLAVGLSIVAYRMREEITELTAIPEQSVAVLPFDNLSGDPSNGFLSVGIQDEIITRLSKIAALKVISRTSTAQYTSKPANLPQIARELGVAAVLEGSVQKTGEQIRVNVQLIKASTDAHLWAETYDRELIDVLKVESEVAKEIAGALRAALTPMEKERVEHKPTNNPDAYMFYLKAIDASDRSVSTSVPLEEAQRFLEQSILLDPNFALAHARLSRVHTWIYAMYQPTEIHKRGSKSEAEEALRLQPNLGEGHVALGNYFGRIERDYDKALHEYETARATFPNDATIFVSSGLIQMEHGQFRKAITDLERAGSLDPRSGNVFDTLGNAYASIKQWAGAERAKKRAAELTTGSVAGHFNEELSWAACYKELTGSFERLTEVIDKVSTDPKDDPVGVIASLRFYTYMELRRYADAERAIKITPATIIEQWNGARVTKNFFLGIAAMVEGDLPKATPLLEADLEFARRELAETPDSANRHGQVGLLCAYLGQKDEAIREGKLAAELLPVERSAFLGPGMLNNLAEIYGRVGEQDAAINLVTRLLRIPAGLTLSQLKTDWNWDPLRGNPRFQKILSEPDPPLVYN